MWIFDLDNTLHDAHARIFPSMHALINQYLQRHYGVDEAGATPFWRAAYGADVDAMKLLVSYGADPSLPTM